jgi:hypothetical protein
MALETELELYMQVAQGLSVALVEQFKSGELLIPRHNEIAEHNISTTKSTAAAELKNENSDNDNNEEE